MSASESEVAQLCLTLSDPMDCSLPGFSVHGIFQARGLEWVPLQCLQGRFTRTATSALRSQSLIHVLDKIDGCFIEAEEEACHKELLV